MHESSFTSIHDLTDSQIMDVLQLAEEFEQDRSRYSDLGKGLIMGSLFMEPSTRTRGSFESAMLRLGGDVITVADAATSSIKKGETLADTARIWSSYCDLIVLRHPWEGSAAAVAEFAGVPVINAGDGGNEHPTQTLVDLFTLMKEYGRIDGLSMAICGDLRKNRSVHSLIYALLRFGVNSYLISPRGIWTARPRAQQNSPHVWGRYSDRSHRSIRQPVRIGFPGRRRGDVSESRGNRTGRPLRDQHRTPSTHDGGQEGWPQARGTTSQQPVISLLNAKATGA